MKKIIFLTTIFLAIIASSYGQFTAANADGKTIRYQVISGTNTVEVLPPSSGNYSGTVDIPPFVINGSTWYQVVTIGEGAFKGNASGLLNEVTFPSTIRTLKKEAVYGTRDMGNTTGVTVYALPKIPPAYSPSDLEDKEVFNRRNTLFLLIPKGIFRLAASESAYDGWGFFQQRYNSSTVGSYPDVPNLTTYTVTIKPNGGILPAGFATTFEVYNGYNVGITNIPTPTRTGYVFSHWTMGGATLAKNWGKSDWTSDATLTAHWELTPYNITYHENDGTAVSDRTAEFKLQMQLFLG